LAVHPSVLLPVPQQLKAELHIRDRRSYHRAKIRFDQVRNRPPGVQQVRGNDVDTYVDTRTGEVRWIDTDPPENDPDGTSGLSGPWQLLDAPRQAGCWTIWLRAHREKSDKAPPPVKAVGPTSLGGFVPAVLVQQSWIGVPGHRSWWLRVLLAALRPESGSCAEDQAEKEVRPSEPLRVTIDQVNDEQSRSVNGDPEDGSRDKLEPANPSIDVRVPPMVASTPGDTGRADAAQAVTRI